MKSFLSFTLKVTIVPTATYTVAGIISSNANDYETLFQTPVINNLCDRSTSQFLLFGPLSNL